MKKIIIIISSVIILGLIIYFVANRNGESPYTLEKVQKHDISQTVSVTGTVEANPKIDLQFQKSGQIAKINVKEGQSVKKGDVLASLENTDLSIQLNSSAANLTFSQAKLEQEIAGAKKEQIALAEIAQERAEEDLKSTSVSYEDLKKVDAESIKKAELAVSEAELNVDKAQNDYDYASKKAVEDVKDAQQSVDSAKTAFDNSQTTVSDTTKTYEQNLNDAYEDINNVMNAGLITTNNNLTAVDNILGVETDSIVNAQEVKIGGQNYGSVDRAEESFKEAKDQYLVSKNNYLNWQSANKPTADIKKIKDDIILALEKANKALNDTYYTLETATTIGQTGLTSELKGLKDMIAAELTTNNTAQTNLDNAYQTILTAQIAKDTNVNTASSGNDTKESAYEDALTNLELVKISSENSINTAEINLQNSEQKLAQSKQNLDQTKVIAQKQENELSSQIILKQIAVKNAEAELVFLTAPPREVDLKSLRANVDKAASDYNSAQYNYNQTILNAPVDGMVVDIKKDLGENITASEIFMVINAAKLLIKANVSETDISKIKLQNKVEMTFDAFDFNDEFEGEVVEISPSETTIEGVVYYQIKISFVIEAGKEIRSGMTANLKIKTAEKNGVLAIPSRAVKYKDNKRFVQILVNGKEQDKEITTGLEGDQFVEIVDGLKEGEEIITFIKQAYTL